jgi:sigma-E factor negative regulatory protein RseC
MKEKFEGVVIKVDADITKARISRHSECSSSCCACPGDNALILDVVDPFGTKPGQHVLLETKERNMLRPLFLFMFYLW